MMFTKALGTINFTRACMQATRNYSSGVGRGVTPPRVSRTPSSSNSQEKQQSSSRTKTELDPDKIKGPGGLTMTQIGKLVQDSRARDLEHLAKKQQGSKK